MPRTPIDYQKTVIYGIFSNSGAENVYIGHTTDFSNRKRGHKNCCNNPNVSTHYNLKLYKIIRENGGWENYTMRIIEEYPCNTRNEAAAREFYYFQQYNATMNYQVPSRQLPQYRIDNDERRKRESKEYHERNKEKIKAYFEANKERFKEKRKIYYEEHKEEKHKKDKIYRDTVINKEEQALFNKKYREENAKSIRIQRKTHYDANKESILLQRKTQYQQKKLMKSNTA